ncbi:TIGR00730 family Rossman fold protein [Actinokineospora sp. NBRC 105648]|uniref:LOG family protein n=1 Tax=Actinokineospora sp. NBRC 105648 TaxID=3032206 RepID=UPI0024A24909|nr:TIGR00730 family Rossman fold protein [Actinokineospora sp. NBRC 105648]GLZ41151.1 cytokinin riboside 5'-monophosphate phosphoribohydrolase [Actinokineospora sp. NBRC 105648]
MSRALCVYCGSNSAVPRGYLDLADEVGAELAARDWSLVWGGSAAAMMGSVARAARRGGARTLGVIPRGLVELEHADPDADELIVVDTMRDRKREMDDRADAFLALPGGLGTCEELFEVWTSRYLGMHAKPVVLLDPDDHWEGMLNWVRELASRGFATQAAVDSLVVARTVTEALDACAG